MSAYPSPLRILHLENLKNQLEEKTNTSLQMASQPRPQDEAKAVQNQPSEMNQEQINNLLHQVNDLTNRLKNNDDLLAQEKEKRLAAEKECNLKVEQLQEVESLFKEEYHRRITTEKSLT